MPKVALGNSGSRWVVAVKITSVFFPNQGVVLRCGKCCHRLCTVTIAEDGRLVLYDKNSVNAYDRVVAVRTGLKEASRRLSDSRASGRTLPAPSPTTSSARDRHPSSTNRPWVPRSANGRVLGGRGRTKADIDPILGVLGPRTNQIPPGGDADHWTFPHKGICSANPIRRTDRLTSEVKTALRSGERVLLLA